MAATDGVLVVLDAGPLIHLDELSCHYLLDGFATLLISSIVWQEAIRHRLELTLGRIPNARISDPAGPSPLPLAPLPCGLQPVYLCCLFVLRLAIGSLLPRKS